MTFSADSFNSPERPSRERFGDWMQTYTGRKFWPLDPRPEDVFVEDIAHSLSLQCRYAGHCLRFYSVAEHSVLLYRWLLEKGHDRETCKWGLLHDAGEAFVSDVVRPLKRSLPGFDQIETKVQIAICTRFQMHPIMPPMVKEIDSRILVDEKRQNMAPGLVWRVDSLEPIGVRLRFWPAPEAEEQFLVAFREVTA